MLTAGYRMPLNYTVDLIESCKNSLERMYTCRDNLTLPLSMPTARTPPWPLSAKKPAPSLRLLWTTT